MTAAPLLDAADESLFGGKATSLGSALRAGLPVPDGFAISWDGVAQIARGDAAAREAALLLFRQLNRAASVRSSAVGEDSADASFAGQHLTVLNVVSEQQFFKAIGEVYESADTDAARAYRGRVGNAEHARIAVVVQRMVNSDVAGVLFTRNPLTAADERVIEASWGLGEAVVAGMVTPDRYRIERSGGILERTAGYKDLEIRFAAEGTEELPVEEARARKLTLSDEQLGALHGLASQCEEAFGRDLDLEFAFEDGVLHLLQSRPITRIVTQPLAKEDEGVIPSEARNLAGGHATSKQRPTHLPPGSLAALGMTRSGTPEPVGDLPPLAKEDEGVIPSEARNLVGGQATSKQRPAHLPPGSLASLGMTPSGKPEPVGDLPPRRLIGFGLAALLNPLNSTMIAVALPSISTDFNASAASVTFWLVSVYLLVSIIVQSPAGKISDLFGYSRVLTAGRILFALGALAGAFAPSLLVLTIGRVAMAIGGSLNIPTVMAELRNEVAPEFRGRLFGLFGALMGTAAAVGPLIGGVLIRNFGWHSVFLVNIPIIILSLILVPLQRTARESKRKVSFDVAGSLLFAISIALIVGGVQTKGVFTLPAIATGVVGIVLFTWYERRVADPLLDLNLFRAREFSAGGLIVALHNFAMYAILFLVPFLFALAVKNSGSTGTLLLAMTASMVVFSAIGGRLSDAIGPRTTAIIGSAVGVVGTVALFIVDPGNLAAVATSLALFGAGIGIASSPSQSAALSAIPRERSGVGAGAISTMRYLGGVFGSAIVGIVVASKRTDHPLVWAFPIALLLSLVIAALLPRRVTR